MRNLPLTIVFIIFAVSPALAEMPSSVACPKRVAAIEGSILPESINLIIIDIYRQLGCNTVIVSTPSRRGIAGFNSGKFDGEMYRGPIIESRYTVKFVRSETPMIVTTNSLWLTQNEDILQTRPLGYLLGVVWQEEYMKGRNALSFHDANSILKAYNSGAISGFTISDLAILAKINQGAVSSVPIRSEILSSFPLYHYLNKQYAPFMTKFSNYLIQNDPFKDIRNFSLPNQ